MPECSSPSQLRSLNSQGSIDMKLTMIEKVNVEKQVAVRGREEKQDLPPHTVARLPTHGCGKKFHSPILSIVHKYFL